MMTRKIIKTVIATSLMILLPAVGNAAIFCSSKLWILLAIYFAGAIFQPDYKVVKDKRNNYDKSTEAQIIWSVYISQFFAVTEASYLRFPDSVNWNYLTFATLIIMLLGLALRSWAVSTLGCFFTMSIQVQPDQHIIKTGPYRFFKHPSYIGAFMSYTAAIIFWGSWYSFFISVPLLIFAWARRIYYEEKMLLDKFGDDYKS